ncbi:MAG: winged helix-turn-helix domain-containing protein [bacterium]|jgi:molybdate transport repressor ModE-like protein|nr:LysR family transcriptional regulator [Betaproteobacteria bacterium]
MNPKADSTHVAVHRWNLGAAPAARVPASVARRAEPPCAQAIDRSRLQLRLSVSIGGAGPGHGATHGTPQASTQVPAAAFELLRRLPRVDSLREAASGLGCSYRHAWALIRGAERALGTPLIDTRRGRGTRLTPYGALLAAALEEIESRLASELDAATQALAAALALGRARTTPHPAADDRRPVAARRRAAA